MDIRVRPKSERSRRWIAEVWTKNEMPGWETFDEPYPENFYYDMNEWCKETFGYHARTAYNIFEFKKRSDLDWFILRWQ
jgi:hypothetical protein